MADEVIAGRYRLEERLGRGGASEVWSARDLDLDREVALKLLGPRADRARFEREARAVAALAHPNVCTLYGYGDTGGRPFMVLELLPGGSLEDRLAAGRPLPDAETQRIAVDVAIGLAHAHAHGVVHRDLKPANVLFDAAGRAKIADFGIARLGEGDGLTAVGTVLGTAAYISPEQAAGRPATPASDVYSFGVILYRMLTGRLPFQSEDGLALVAMHRDTPPPPVSSLRPDAPPRLESVATAALAKSPADRPRDGAALVAELGGTTRETAATAILPPTRRGRTGLVVAAAAVLAGAGVALAMVITFRGGSSGVPPSSAGSTSVATTASTPAPATTESAPPTSPVTTESTAPAVTTAPVPTVTTVPTETLSAPTTAPVTIPPAPTVPTATSAPLPTSPPPTTAPLPTETTAPTDTTAPTTTAAQTDTAPPG